MNLLQIINARFIAKVFPSLSYYISYIHNHRRFPNLFKPKDLSEIWYKKAIKGDYLKYFELADKYKVRKYVSDKGWEDILIPLLSHYYSVKDIDFSIIPQKFALKMNFGAGMNIICLDKSNLEINKCKQLLEEWFDVKNYSFTEQHYSKIEKCAVCEEFIDDGNGGFPIDYKFMCIHGKVVCVLACSGREKGHADYLPYSLDWQPMYDYYKVFDRTVPLVSRPQNLDKMIECAESLAGDIDLVRIDLYSNGSRIWFGEITLTPAGCIFHRWSNRALDEMGALYLKSK